jgi:hypothetical protein
MVWLAGWSQVASVMYRAGDHFGLCFLAFMVSTGIVAVVLCPVGVSSKHDAVHYVAAGLYMVDHFILCEYFGVSPTYVRAFAAALLAFFVFTTWQSSVLAQVLLSTGGQVGAFNAAMTTFGHRAAHPSCYDTPSQDQTAISPHMSNEERAALLRSLHMSVGVKRQLFVAELAEMVTENLLFFFFISGMASGLQPQQLD